MPITKDQSQRLEEEDPQKTVESVRLAQKATGELMWLGTKTRPDLMFTLARMSQSTLRSPKEVVTVGAQARKYLRKTLEEGLWMKKDEDEDLVVYTDSSYGPGGMESQGTVVVMWGSTAIMWKAGKQPTPALSTAESELAEAVEGMIMGDSVDVMIQELAQKPYAKMIKIDNQAAVNLLAEPAGGWRTRHLRLRASNLRWRLSRTDWMTEAIPGADQIADVGTKVLTAPRLEVLKKMMGMGKMKKEEKTSQEDEKTEESAEDEAEAEKKKAEEREKKIALVKATNLIQLAVIVGCMGQVNAQGQEEEDQERAELFHAMVLFALAVIGLMSLIERIAPVLRRLFTRRRDVNQPEEETPPEREEEEDEEEVDPAVPFEHGNPALQPLLPRNIARPKPPPAALVNRLRTQAPMMVPEDQPPAMIPQDQTPRIQQDQPARSSNTPLLQAPQPPLAICHFAWPRKTDPTKSPEKELFPEFPKGNLTLGGVRFPGRTQVENWQPPSQPAEEPPRLVDEFLGSVVQEPVEHPEDANWDQSGPGKGSPRPASSATNSSATIPARDLKGSPGTQAKGRWRTGKEVGKKGQKGGPAKGKATESEEEAEREYEAQELPEEWTPEDQRRGRGPAYVTQWGTKWHFLTTCPALANTRVKHPSRWCSLCARWLHYDGPIYTAGVGQTAHQDQSCPRITSSRTYQQCQICCEHYERTA